MVTKSRVRSGSNGRCFHPASLFELRPDKKDDANFVIFFTLQESRRAPDPALSRVRGSARQLHPLRLGSATLRLLVAVGMPVTRHPPHRSQQALLTHWAPASGNNVQTQVRIRMTNSWRRYPACCKAVHSVPISLMPLASAT